jgi:hypothetical protein
MHNVPELPPPQGPEQPATHTMTINNGDCVVRKTFVWENGSWQAYDECNVTDVFFRDCPSSPWRFYGTYGSPRRAEEVACALRANGNLASVQHHQS